MEIEEKVLKVMGGFRSQGEGLEVEEVGRLRYRWWWLKRLWRYHA